MLINPIKKFEIPLKPETIAFQIFDQKPDVAPLSSAMVL